MPELLSRRRMLRDTSGAVALGLLPITSALAASGKPITIAEAVGVLNLMMDGLMKQEKFLEEFGLAPNMLGVPDGSKILSGVVGGSADASAMSGFGQVFPAIERGAPIKMIAASAQVPTLALFTGKPNIHSLKDLEGKNVGTGSIGALVHQLTVTVLKKYNVDTSKIRFVNIGSSANIFRAVQAGTVDAGAGEASLLDVADAYHVRPIPHGNLGVELPLFTFNGSWTSDSKIATQRDILVRMLAAYAKLYRFAQNPASHDAFFRNMRQVFPTEPEANHQAMWRYIQTYKPFAVNLELGPDRIKYIQQLNVDFGIQKSILPYEKVADMSLAREALKLLK
jgi:ABC-type nitrate/sulfonate/bicarbonate transport system substrate-binding protein